MTSSLLFSGLAAVGLATLSLGAGATAQPYAPYADAPVAYPWRNGVIEGPAVIGPGPEAPAPGYAAPGYAPTGGYDPNLPYDPNTAYGATGYAPQGEVPIGPQGVAYPVAGYGGPGGYGQTQGVTVTQSPDGDILVTRYGPVWTSKVGPNGWAHRHYYHYGWPWSGLKPVN